MVRRFQDMDDDTYDDYSRYQQTGPKRKPPARYEVARPSLRSLQSSMKAKIITVYTNGDKYIHDKPITLAFKTKIYPQLASLLDDIARRKERINKTLVRYLFKWPSGEECVDVQEIGEDDDTTIYVCSDTRKLYKKGRYGGIEFGGEPGVSSKYSRNSHDSRGTLRSEKPSPIARSNGSTRGQPVNITVISNTNRVSKQSLFIDPKSNLPFESILQNVTEMLDMDHPPCVALYSVKPPYKKVDSISSFNRIVPQYGDTFWACGREGEPIEKTEKSNRTSRDSSPMRNGYSHNQRGKNGNGPRQNGYHDNKARQSDTYEDSQGREYKRYKSQENNQYDEEGEEEYEDETPTRSPPRRQSPPRRDDKRRMSQQQRNRDDDDDDEKSPRRDKKRDAQQPKSKSKTPRRDESDDERRDDKNDKQSDDEGDNSRGNSPDEEEMAGRIADMDKPNDDLDKDIDY